MSNTEANSIIQIVQYFNSNSELLNNYNSGKQFDIADPNSVIYLLNNIFNDALSKFPLLLDNVFNILKTNKPPLMMQIAEHYKTDLDKNKLEVVMRVIQDELIPYYTQNTELITNLSSAQKPPTDVATKFFNDQAIAKPAPATTASSGAPASVDIKNKYGLINKLVGRAASKAEAEAAVKLINDKLGEAAASDTDHDFNDKSAVKGITNLIETTYKNFYLSGLPDGVTLKNIPSEEQTINSVIQPNTYKFIQDSAGGGAVKFGTSINSNSFQDVDYSPLTAMKFIKEGIVTNTIKNNDKAGKTIVQSDGCVHEFITVTGNEYKCTYFDVKPEIVEGSKVKKGEIIDAQTFFEKMGAGGKFDIGLIVDCVSITLEDIFNKSPIDSAGKPQKITSEKTVRLIKSSEGENDPGGKQMSMIKHLKPIRRKELALITKQQFHLILIRIKNILIIINQNKKHLMLGF
jgi:hypothetical protein